ncbi:N-acylneuraminate-9-phosphatase [Orchesella cincta]|uniref:N-acylneuraminate-9-phosphatase n=1 Tax=Orchesella cincta TaxID=48709 RepID=A0A1D2MF54_ORCCI|nr:N-acylneuraminate-9-phosphatase [Orchesella cincta]
MHVISEIMTREMDIPVLEAKKACDTFLRRFRRCPEAPRMQLDEWRLLLWIEALGEEYEEVAEVIYLKWRKLRYRHMALSEGKMNMLRSLHKQYQLALVTNGPSQSQWEKIRELKIAEHFDTIVVSGDLKYEKPQPEIFHRACTKLGVEPFECLMVGDKIETDIVGGFEAEIGITMWVLPPEGAPAEKPNPPPDFIVADVMELPGILQSGKEKARSKGLRASGKSSSSGACSSSGASTSGSTVAGAVGGGSTATSSGASVAAASNKVPGQSADED